MENVRFAGEKIEARTPARRLPRIALGLGFLLAVAAATLLGVVPAVVLIGYGLLGCVSYILYTLDKAAAGKGGQRTPESTLHLVDLLGGWPGALIAQQQSRHKTVKASFQAVFWFTVLGNITGVVWLVRSGMAEVVTGMLLGG